mmetsp:Transcript_132996/g.384639  ORF Transcript_132996/g.384639 Transcript_132996/m.384639 type:complete len:222 (-) Transcript_132996:41-706(-)
MRGVLLRLALLHEHEELTQHGHRFQVQREGPRDVGGQEVVQVRVEDQADPQRRHYQVQVVQRVGARLVRARESRPAEVDDRAREAQADRLAELVEPIARLVEGEISLERNDGEESANKDRDVTLHHLQGHSLHRSAAFYLDHHHQEAKDANQGGQCQEEGEVPAGEEEVDGEHEREEAGPNLERLGLHVSQQCHLQLLRILYRLLKVHVAGEKLSTTVCRL